MRSRALLLGSILAVLVGAVSSSKAEFIPGDLNTDQSVDVLDAVVLQLHLAGLPPGISQQSGAAGINVIDYGADPTGATPACPGILAAIAAASDGDYIYFPNGTYDVECLGAFDLTKSVVWVGDPGSTLDAGTNASEIRLADGLSRVGFIGLTFRNFRRVVTQVATGTTLSQFLFLNNVVEDCETGLSISMKIDQAFVRDNRFADLAADSGSGGVASAIMLGYKDPTGEYPMSGRLHISGNNIENVTTTASTSENHAILARGRQVFITQNAIRNVSAPNTSASSEGIYAAAERVIISENSLYDAGDYAFVTLKSLGRGRGHQVSNNVFFQDVSTGTPIGIDVFPDDVVVRDNVFHDMRGRIVNAAFGASGLQVLDNVVDRPQGTYLFYARGSDIRMDGNSINRPAYTTAASFFVFLIQGLSDGTPIDNVVLTNNQIKFDDSLATTANAYAFLILDNTVDVTNLTVAHNIIDQDSSNTPSMRFFAASGSGAHDRWNVERNIIRGTFSGIVDFLGGLAPTPNSVLTGN